MHHRAKPERFYLSQNVSQFSKKKLRIFKLFKSTVARKDRNLQELADLNSHPRWENVTTAIQMPAGLLWIFLPLLYQEYSQLLYGHKRKSVSKHTFL